MNKAEFNQWIADYSKKFPDSGKWITENKTKILGDWQRALSDVSLSDALEVNIEMMAGDLDPVNSFNRETTPAVIRRHAKAMNRERQLNESPDQDRERYGRCDREAPIGSARGFMQQIETLVATGMTGREAAAKVFPNARESHQRYSCLACKDNGWVDVWSNEAIQAAIQVVPLPEGARARMCVLCSCEKGDRKKSKERFSHDKYCEFGAGDPDELREWITKRQVANLERRRHKEFDEFNKSGARA